MRSRAVVPLMALAVALSRTLPAQQLVTSTDSARHALQRLAWGPAPGEVDRIAAEGVMAWVEHQLAVRSVSDPSRTGMEAGRLSLRTSTIELLEIDARLRREALARADSAGARPDAATARQGNPLRQVLGDHAALTLERQVSSDHQLAEVLADFWFNHFNIFQNKGLDRVLLRDHVEDVIRGNALGSFEALLLATARSPAMLFYLDNAQSVAPGADPRDALAERFPAMRNRRRSMAADPRIAQLRQRMPQGLNENYARELLELHTLGVDGGYTQDDVVAVARILTGWSLDRRTGTFQWNAWAHDRGEKVVLGTRFPAGGGREEGEQLLRLLAAHPATMHHVSGKLCARLVADVPPDGCIDDAVRAWKRSNGEIREVVRAIVTGPDFWSAVNAGSKVKSPHEFVVSAVRALGGAVGDTPVLAAQVARLGQPLFQQSAPTGWPETQDEWVSSAALLARMNFAVTLASGRMPGVTIDLDRLVPATDDHDAMLDAINATILAGGMRPGTRHAILEQVADLPSPASARAMAVGLALGGPDFQRQ